MTGLPNTSGLPNVGPAGPNSSKGTGGKGQGGSGKKGPGSSGLKVTDTVLANFDTLVQKFLLDYEHATWHVPLLQFQLATPGNSSGSPGKLLTGQKPFGDAELVTSSFTSWCKSLFTDLETLRGQFEKMGTNLQNAKSILNNGESQALSAAQMMQILDPVVQSLPSTGGVPTGA